MTLNLMKILKHLILTTERRMTMKIVLDRQTTAISIQKNAENVDLTNYFWNAVFTTDFKIDGDVRVFMKLICKFLKCPDIKVADRTEVRLVADSRTGYFSFTIELKEMTTLTMAEIN